MSNNRFTITGKFLGANATKEHSAKFKTRDFYVDVTDNADYPSPVQFQAINDACDFVEFEKGADIEVSFSLRGRIWQAPNGKRVITNLSAFKVGPANEEQPTEKPVQVTKEETFPDPDDLPF